MKELFERIIAWHEKNLPAGLPYEPLPQIGFLSEELHEVNKEFIKGDIDAAVGEITDLIVFSVNAIVLLKGDKEIIEQRFFYGDYPVHDKVTIIGILNYRIFKINDISVPEHKRFNPWRYKDLIESCVKIIFSLGYSPELALEETVKKIESRRGAWDSSIGKWVKEKNQMDVYKPDYSLAN